MEGGRRGEGRMSKHSDVPWVDSRYVSVGKRSSMTFIKDMIEDGAFEFPMNRAAFYGLSFSEAFHAYYT